MIIVFIDGKIFKCAENRLLAKASFRWARVSMTVVGMFSLVEALITGSFNKRLVRLSK